MVDASGSEWAEVEGQLKESLPTAELVRLERVEDRLLWRDYCSKRDRIELTRGGNANEQKMWHGTSALDPHKALEHEVGIDPRFSSAAFYGRGVYLAAKARYSNGDEDRTYVFYPDYPDRELRQLLLLRAAVGVSKDFGSLVSEKTRNLTKPPEQSPGVLFDSVQGGPHRPSRAGEGSCDSTMVVMYDLTQAYPEYIVTYRVREKPGWFRWR
ncbi:hypothetical protein EMIHUDRAFT_113916 [Emiliania huxleyi CCMP1516]|uniref:Poly [ADP-ribose] polymerase n=2 Tax=Emiliania huxleyi TaxID=2903 RepID=A0A0D3JZU7_EMIH1|nr:hypothetical protein EMIHUDRAFT_113916 [Emiliania huxleyi CCMP1516]EOD29032.1 hypothetical protein EMIHUDRAFT_113916 [Emiliania huxleyi CCMP1516]|eukprot:XP_005781461.1 hypothetical protein EMIHUDRAFT_113916 [Emiliania huxleyi CCMP1516]